MYGLTRAREKQVDDALERDTHPKGEKQSGLTTSAQYCALVLLYIFEFGRDRLLPVPAAERRYC